MPSPSSPPSRQTAIRTGSIEEARALYSALSIPILRVEPRGRLPFAWEARYAQLGDVALSSNRFGGHVRVDSEAVNATYALTLPVGHARGLGTFDGVEAPFARGRLGSIASPGMRASVELGDAFRGVNVDFRAAALEAALASLVDEAPRGRLRFSPGVALDARAMSGVVRAIEEAREVFDARASENVSPHRATELTERLMYALLLAQPHNHSAALRMRYRDAEPAHVRLAADYIDANASSPIRMVELAALTRVSARALQSGFLAHRGCTPMTFLRERRLAHARALLRDAPHRTVSDVAIACGFDHLGRFSAHYRALYGERPSATRARRRA